MYVPFLGKIYMFQFLQPPIYLFAFVIVIYSYGYSYSDSYIIIYIEKTWIYVENELRQPETW